MSRTLTLTKFALERLVQTKQYENVRLQLEVALLPDCELSFHEAVEMADGLLSKELALLRREKV